MERERYATQYGGTGLIIDGYKFRKHRTNKNSIAWCCCVKSCKSRCTTDMEIVVLLTQPSVHSHAADPNALAKDKLRETIKRKAVDELNERASKVVCKGIGEQGITDTDLRHLKNLKEVVYRARLKLRPSLPSNRLELSSTMAPNIKVTYFELRGRGEVIRLILHAAKKNFEDKRVTFPEWAVLKPNTPFGSLPIVEIDGQVFGQSLAIATYLAKEFGFYASNNQDAFKIEQIQQLREDLVIEESKVLFDEKDEAKKAELNKKLVGEIYPKYLDIFVKLVEANKESEYVIGKKLTLADIVLFEGLTTVAMNHPELIDQRPVLKKLRDSVAQADGIKQYLTQRKVDYI